MHLLDDIHFFRQKDLSRMKRAFIFHKGSFLFDDRISRGF